MSSAATRKRGRAQRRRMAKIFYLVAIPLVLLTILFYEYSYLSGIQTEDVVKGDDAKVDDPPPAEVAVKRRPAFKRKEDTLGEDELPRVPAEAKLGYQLDLQKKKAAENGKKSGNLRKKEPAPPKIPIRTIMILIANYRDSHRCSETLDSIFSKAVNPDALSVGIFDQIYAAEGEKTCVEIFCEKVGEDKCRRTQISNSSIDAANATGPTGARYETEKFIKDEDYCLAIDSHIVFVEQWDLKMLQQWDSLENEYAILTVYPKSTKLLTEGSKSIKSQLMCKSSIESKAKDAMIQYSAPIWIDPPTKPRLQSQLAGGFNFGTCKQAREIRNDPHTPFLFHGEEYSRAARLWTSGYDFYTPNVDLLYHWYEPRKVVWERDWGTRYVIQQKSARRIRHVLGLSTSSDDFDRTDIESFSLGTVRSMEQWRKFSGIDPTLPYTGDKAQFDNCKELEYVKY